MTGPIPRVQHAIRGINQPNSQHQKHCGERIHFRVKTAREQHLPQDRN
jgi:hypothetical protein